MQRVITGDSHKAASYLREAEKLLAYTKKFLRGQKYTKLIGDGTIIQVSSVAGLDKIYIHSPTGPVEIVLASPSELAGYSHTANKLYAPVEHSTDSAVFPAFPKHVLTDNGLFVYVGTKALPKKLGTVQHLFGYFPRYGGTIGLTGTSLDFVSDVATTLGIVENKGFAEIVPQSVFAMARYNETNTWNQLDVPYVWQIPPHNVSGSIERWHWQPRIWYPDKENLYYAAGMWYGAVGYRTYGPAEEIHVQFGCLLDDHYGNHFGYCEVFKKAIGLKEPGSGLPPEDKDFLEAWFSLDLSDVGRTSFVDANSWGIRFVHNSTWMQHKAPAFSIDYLGFFGVLPGGTDLELAFWSGPPKEVKEDETPSTGSYGTIAHANGQYAVHAHREYASMISSSFVASGSGYVSHSISSDGRYIAVLKADGISVYDITTSLLVSEKELPHSYQTAAFVPEVHIEALPAPAETAGTAFNLSRVEMSPAVGGVTAYWQPANQGNETSGWKVICKDGINAVGIRWGDECWEWEMTRIRPTDSQNLYRIHTVSVEGVSYSASSFFGLAEVLPYYLGIYAGIGALFQEIILARWDESGRPLAVLAHQGANTNVSTIRRADISLLYGFGVSTGGPDYYTPSENAVGPYHWHADNGSLTEVDGGPIDSETYKVLFVPPEKVCNDSFGTVNVTDSCGRKASRVVELIGPPELRVVVDLPHIYASGGIAPYKITASCGTYDEETGTLDYSGCCGSGTATATDSCGRTATKEIKFPVGAWVNSGEQECARLDCSYPPTTAQRQYLYLSDTRRLSMMVDKDCCFIHSDALPQIEPDDCAMTWQNVDILDNGEDCTSSFAPYGGVWYPYDGIVRWIWFTKQPQEWACP